MLLAQDIRDRERGGRAEIGIIEGDDEAASSDLMKVLESELGERTQEIEPAISDEMVDQQQKASLFLYWCVENFYSWPRPDHSCY